MTLRQVGEDRLLGQLLPSLALRRNVILGAGDDCAAVRSPGESKLLLLKTDCVVEEIHFGRKTDPVLVGWKAMMRPLSDFAAMSGIPQFALITITLAAARSTSWVRRVYRGLNSAARRFDVSIVGGETSNTNGPSAISVSVAGFVEKDRCVSRRGGKSGDDLFVTGKLGGSRRGRHLRFLPRIEESRWLSKHFAIHAMIDLSDGLGSDLPRLARASNLGFEIDESRLPLNSGAKISNAISDGEDYELLFAISRRDRVRLEKSWRKKFPKLLITRIGRLSQASTVNPQPLRSGYVHFK
ncbi:MAG TPA: thiamine-phosphate kinase [Chthoniobacterales bacterium]|nr:thiamine-phosphate kinase [Chthoniobacterales bacterium]